LPTQHIFAVGIYVNPDTVMMPFISVLETNQKALAVRAYAKKVGVPVIQNISLARENARIEMSEMSFSMDELDELLKLLFWLYDVESEGYYKLL